MKGSKLNLSFNLKASLNIHLVYMRRMASLKNDLIKEYSPSLNTKRFQNFDDPKEEAVRHFVDYTTNATLVACQTYQVKRNVRYGGNNDNQLVDIYYKQHEMHTPIFVFIHGGYWQAITKDSTGPFVTPLVECGFRVIAVEFDLCPNVTLEEQTSEIHSFFVWLFNYATETQANYISICGHSAGAHLAMTFFKNHLLFMAGAERVVSFFMISGVYDLTDLWNLDYVNPNNILALTAQKAYDLSPIFWNFTTKQIDVINQRNIEMHLLVTENDSETYKSQTKELYNKFKALNWKDVNLKLHIFNDYDHFDVIENMNLDGSLINRYIIQNLPIKQ